MLVCCASSQAIIGTVALGSNWTQLKRIARYLNGTRQYAVRLRGNKNDSSVKWDTVIGYSDANQAGDRTHRRSTTCGMFIWGGNLIESFSRTQKVIGLSSAETEYYAMADIASETIFLSKIISFITWKHIKVEIHVDSSAALGIARRLGVGLSLIHI